jgi:hypothetical protein
MSGGGGKKEDTKSTNTTMPMDTVQPAMPGQLNALSQQLASGYGQAPADIMSQLMQYYAPMSLPDYGPQPTPTPAPKPAPTPAPKPGGGIIGGKGSGDFIHSGGANR